MNRRLYFLVVLPLLLVGCCSNFDRIQKGMGQKEVIDLLGKPAEMQRVSKGSFSIFDDSPLLNRYPVITVMVYRCKWDDDLVVFFSPDAKVAATDRLTVRRSH